jgi:formate-dependent nitrite reductase membrane component NrfD
VSRLPIAGPIPMAQRERRASPSAHRRGGTLHLEDQGSQPAPPVKGATWEWYIPIYFWLGGISGGAWLMTAAEDLAGGRDRRVIRAARYVALGSLLGGTALLIADLGRPDRFLNMLRVFRRRSTMSLGAWGLTLYGGLAGAAALLQVAEDGWLGNWPMLSRMSRGAPGRVLHALGLPPALFVGGYTGVLLGATNTPSWARRARLLGPLFLSSAVSSGAAAVSAAVELAGGVRRRTRRRLARAERAALASELALTIVSEREAHRLVSAHHEPGVLRPARGLMLAAGMAAPLALAMTEHRGKTRRRKAGLASAALALAGSLGLRYLTTYEGYRSARTPDDTWRHTARLPPRDHE